MIIFKENQNKQQWKEMVTRRSLDLKNIGSDSSTKIFPLQHHMVAWISEKNFAPPFLIIMDLKLCF